MTGVGTSDAPLHWGVFMTPSIPMIVTTLPPGQKQMVWQPMASTLIYGKRDAAVVDTLMTVEQTNALIDWIAASGKNLTTVYVTHGHGDHWFGIGAILRRFPHAKAVAAPEVVDVMRQRMSPAVVRWWEKSFPGQIPDHLVTADALQGNTISLEGQELVAVDVGHGDSDHSTCLHVPSIGLVVAGDVAYNGAHLYFVESPAPKRREWIVALDKIESLHPAVVIAGHKRSGREDSPRIIEETRQYIRDFDRLDGVTTTTEELYDRMLHLYPDRVNPGMQWTSARAAKGGAPFQ
jgi:glyoxylase-like metal-dependent hydrolase (beta-lactamase superfamily II)